MIKIDILASGSKGNAYIISDGVTNLLVECGISWKEIQRKSGFRKIDACFVSHEHQDHCKAIKDVLKMGITTYMPFHLAEKTGSHNAKGVILADIYRNGWGMKAFELQHDVPTLAYVIDINMSRVVYITDTMYCKYTIPNVTHWMIECNYSKDILDSNVASGKVNQELRNRIVQSHMELNTVKDMLRANDLSKTEVIYLMHLSDNNSNETRFKQEIQILTGKEVKVC